MPTIVFVIDAGASMATRDVPASALPSAPRHTRFDCAKAATETMYRAAQRGARLAHHPEPPVCLLVVATPAGATVVHDGYWTGSAATPGGGGAQGFESALKLLPCAEPLSSSSSIEGSSPPHGPLNSALSLAFQLLSRHRWPRGADTPGEGRRPWALDPGGVVLLTDGDAHRGPDARVQLPSLPRRDEELCSAPFRWDQRLFTLVVNGSNNSSGSNGASGEAGARAVAAPRPLAVMAEATGGRHWPVATQLPALLGCAAAAAHQIARGGVVVRLKALLPNSPPGQAGQSGQPGQPPPAAADPGALVLLGVPATHLLPAKPAPTAAAAAAAAQAAALQAVQACWPGGPCRPAGCGSGHWPLPEEVWVSRASPPGPPSGPVLPPRPAHPTLWCAPPAGPGAAAAAAALDAWCFTFGLPVDWYDKTGCTLAFLFTTQYYA
jgi:hypothetical protein